MNALGDAIAERCDALGVTQAEFAEAIGMSPGGLSRIKKGSRTNLSGETWYKLALGLGCSMEDVRRLASPEEPSRRNGGKRRTDRKPVSSNSS